MRTDVPKTRTEVKDLERLRKLFLETPEHAGTANYWADDKLLELYDKTYARRIAWKWDAVLEELNQRNWKPPARLNRWIDWGCGSGVATETVLQRLKKNSPVVHVFSDRSQHAMTFSSSKMEKMFPGLKGECIPPEHLKTTENDLLLVSHVLTELTTVQFESLAQLVKNAGAVLWVEPGTPFCSEKLISIRGRLSPEFSILAPCPHQSVCGLQSPHKDWCHFFASPPAEIFQDSAWMRFAKTMKIDLRSLPVSFLAAHRRAFAEPEISEMNEFNQPRVIGRPRFYKGHAKVLLCQETGISEETLQQRENKKLFREWQQDSFFLQLKTDPDSD